MASNNDALVQTAGVYKTFRDFWHREKVTAVHDLDLEVLPHEVFGLLGPNGSGKSTTIKMILGLLYPTKGFIRVFGKRPTDVSIKERIGFLPEESYLYPFLTARETLDYYGRLFRQPRPERIRRTDMLLEMVGLSAVAYRRVGEYSKGMQRRLGLAQALINDPDLLILDEPTSGLDPLGTRQFKDLIQELSRRGKTVILCSHLLGDVEDVCDRVSILYGGRLRATGDLDDLLKQQGLTQIISERLDDDTVQQIRDLIARQEKKSVLEVTSPRDKLETLFLRIVEQARVERVTTGGAVATGEVAEFLRSKPASAKEVIEQLLGEEPAEEPAAETGEPQQVEPTVSEDVLEELAEAPEPERAKPTPSANETAPTETKPAAADADRGVLDSLMGDETEQEPTAGDNPAGKDSHA